MNLNDKKICFIICYNQEIYLQECLLYLQQLHVPDGFSTDLLTIADAPSMTEGYQAAMEASDARYKIYMHQDVFIVYPYFLDSLIEIFQSSPQIGMAGMVGSPVFPSDHMMWSEKLTGNLYHRDMPPCDYHDYRYSLEHGLSYVDSIDGLLMATAYDIPWRTDLLHGWNFYDVSQSFEFRRRGTRELRKRDIRGVIVEFEIFRSHGGRRRKLQFIILILAKAISAAAVAIVTVGRVVFRHRNGIHFCILCNLFLETCLYMDRDSVIFVGLQFVDECEEIARRAGNHLVYVIARTVFENIHSAPQSHMIGGRIAHDLINAHRIEFSG